uniref:Uncharacterized protein n=1 Tax=Anopheles atroparvus TaxID=41427 RepID=A0A182IXF9_ANOAO
MPPLLLLVPLGLWMGVGTVPGTVRRLFRWAGRAGSGGGLGLRDDTHEAAVVVVVAVVVASPTSSRCCTFEPCVVSCVVSELVRVRDRFGMTLFSSFSWAFTSARAAHIGIQDRVDGGVDVAEAADQQEEDQVEPGAARLEI